jgi:hypothetical protein
MNKEKVTWGLTLFGIGLILLLNNLDVIDFQWRVIFRLWPLFIIIVGVNLLFSKSTFGKALSVLVTVLCIGLVLYVGINEKETRSWRIGNFSWSDEDIDRGGRYMKNYLSADYDNPVKEAKLEIRGGLVEYEIEKPDPSYLFWSEVEGVLGGHNLEVHQTDSTARLLFSMKDQNRKRNWSNNEHNEAKIRLHPDPVWNIEMKIGAGTADFDLRQYKVSRLEMNCGAASVEVKLGQPEGHSVVSVESGAASIEIDVPRDVACKIVTRSSLSSKSFKGFEKQSDGSYTSPGYTEAENRYTINLQGGISSFQVKRY